MNPPATALVPSPRVIPNAWSLFGGVWRLTIRRALVLRPALVFLALLAGVGLLSVVSVRHSAPSEYNDWVTGFCLSFLIPVLAFISAAGALRDDLKPATADYVFTRPVRRAVYSVAKYTAHTAVAEISLFLIVIVAVGVAVQHGPTELTAHLPRLVLAHVLTVAVASGFGFLCAMLTSRYVVLGLVYAGIVEAGIGQIPTQLSRLSMMRQVRIVLQPLTDATVPGSAANAALVLVLVTVVCVVASALLLHFRELLGERTRES